MTAHMNSFIKITEIIFKDKNQSLWARCTTIGYYTFTSRICPSGQKRLGIAFSISLPAKNKLNSPGNYWN